MTTENQAPEGAPPMPDNVLAGAVCTVAEARGYVAFGAGVYRVQETREPGLVVTFRRDGEQAYAVGARAPEADLTPIPSEDIIVRLQFTSAAGLDSLEAHLRSIRAEHWPETIQPHAVKHCVTYDEAGAVAKVEAIMSDASAVTVVEVAPTQCAAEAHGACETPRACEYHGCAGKCAKPQPKGTGDADCWLCPKCGIERGHFPACAQDGCPLMLNGLTEAETAQTASVSGLAQAPAPAPESGGALTEEQLSWWGKAMAYDGGTLADGRVVFPNRARFLQAARAIAATSSPAVGALTDEQCRAIRERAGMPESVDTQDGYTYYLDPAVARAIRAGIAAVLGTPVAWADPNELAEGPKDTFLVMPHGTGRHGEGWRFKTPLYTHPVASPEGIGAGCEQISHPPVHPMGDANGS